MDRISNKSIKILTGIYKAFTVGSIILMVALVFFNAICRYVINISFPATEELARFFFIWVCYLGIVAAYADGEHVSVNLLVKNLKGIPKIILTVLTYAAILIALYVMLMGAFRYTQIASTYNTIATGTNFAVITLSQVFCAIALIFITIKKIIVEFKG